MICSAMEMAQAISGYALLPSAGAATHVGVVPGHWGAATSWAGPRGASSVRSVSGMGLSGADGAGPEMEGAVMA